MALLFEFAFKRHCCRFHYCHVDDQSPEVTNMRTVPIKSPKSRIQHCERSELRLHFEWTNVNQK